MEADDDIYEQPEAARSFQLLNNLDNYDVLEQERERLWKMVLERLISGINNVDADSLFPDMNIIDADYSMMISLATNILAWKRYVKLIMNAFSDKKNLMYTALSSLRADGPMFGGSSYPKTAPHMRKRTFKTYSKSRNIILTLHPLILSLLFFPES